MLKWLNIKPEFDYGRKHTLEWKKPDGRAVVLEETGFEGNPLKEGATLKARGKKNEEKKDAEETVWKITVDATHFRHLEVATKALVFVKDGNQIGGYLQNPKEL